jgi:hypothetical protein
VASKRERGKKQVVGFLGVGFDNQDGHHRLTRTDNFLLVGGSEETHESLQETAIKFNEALDRRGKPLHEATVEEIIELFYENHP